MGVIRHRAQLSAWWCDDCRAVVPDNTGHEHITRRVELTEPADADRGAVEAGAKLAVLLEGDAADWPTREALDAWYAITGRHTTGGQ